MGVQSDDKTQKSAYEHRQGRVVEDQRGHRLWQGTIKTLKLSLMKTGIFHMSETQHREAGTDDASNHLDEDLESIDDGGGFDPYDSAKK